MRPPMVLAVVWLVAAAVATAVGFTATHTVGDVISGSGPVGAEYRPVADPTSDRGAGTLPPRTATFRYPAGHLTVRCEGRAASLVTTRAAVGWRVSDSELGPDEDVDVSFTRHRTTTRVEVYCNEGKPRPVLTTTLAEQSGR